MGVDLQSQLNFVIVSLFLQFDDFVSLCFQFFLIILDQLKLLTRELILDLFELILQLGNLLALVNFEFLVKLDFLTEQSEFGIIVGLLLSIGRLERSVYLLRLIESL